MKRRDFFKALVRIFGVDVWTSAFASRTYIHVPDGRSIVVEGNADHEDILAKMRDEMAASQAEMMAKLQRNIGQMSAKWNDRYS